MNTHADLRSFRKAWMRQYERLARTHASLLPAGGGTAVEMGCGKGQLTIHLLRAAPAYRVVGVDRFEGPYAAWRETAKSAFCRGMLRDRATLVVSDCRAWMATQPADAYEAVLSNEFLCDFDAQDLVAYARECFRVLKPGGITANSFLSPAAANRAQQLLVEANVDPRWAEFPPRAWFSPPPVLVRRSLRDAGFAEVRMHRQRCGVTIRGPAARVTLERWHTRRAFWAANEEFLSSTGLQFPDWILIFGMKPHGVPPAGIARASRRGRRADRGHSIPLPPGPRHCNSFGGTMAPRSPGHDAGQEPT